MANSKKENFVERFLDAAEEMKSNFASPEELHLMQVTALFQNRGFVVTHDNLNEFMPQLLEEVSSNPDLKPAIYARVLAEVATVMKNVGSENPICGGYFAQADKYSRIVPSDICEETFINTCSYLAKLTEVLDIYRPVCYIRNPSLKPTPPPSTTPTPAVVADKPSASVTPTPTVSPSATASKDAVSAAVADKASASATPTATVSPSVTASKDAAPAVVVDEASASATSTPVAVPTVSSTPSVSANNTDLASTTVPVSDDLLDVAGATNTTEVA
jgi:hypothetical protein